MKEKKQSSLKAVKSQSYLALTIVLVVMILSVATFGVAFILLKDMLQMILEIVGGALLLLSLIAMFVIYVYFSEKQYRLFYDTLYKGSIKNLEAIKDRKLEVEEIKDESVKEFQEVNEIFDDINNQYKGKVIVSKDGDIENIPLEYLDDTKVLVSYDSLVNNIVDLIIVTKSFRNALAEIYYELDEEMQEADDFSWPEDTISVLYKGNEDEKEEEEESVLSSLSSLKASDSFVSSSAEEFFMIPLQSLPLKIVVVGDKVAEKTDLLTAYVKTIS